MREDRPPPPPVPAPPVPALPVPATGPRRPRARAPAAPPADPFPRDRFAALLRRLPAYGRLAWRLGRDPLLGRTRRAAVVAAAAYLASPIDFVPGIIPVLGQLDDLAVAIVALRLALDGLSPERRRAHLEAVGLDESDLVDDLRVIGATTAWIAHAGVALTARLLREGGRRRPVSASPAARHARPPIVSPTQPDRPCAMPGRWLAHARRARLAPSPGGGHQAGAYRSLD